MNGKELFEKLERLYRKDVEYIKNFKLTRINSGYKWGYSLYHWRIHPISNSEKQEMIVLENGEITTFFLSDEEEKELINEISSL